jgi:dolichol-phosphate mannosyltransferase
MEIFPEGSGLENLRDKVTVVVLTLNEAEAVGPLIEEVKACGYRNILVVDGYSTDRTDKIASSLGAEVVRQHGKGKAGAVLTAREIVKTPYFIVMDGDYTYDPRALRRMERKIIDLIKKT